MWKGHYGKEPFDLRLTVLRMRCQFPVIAIVTLLGMLVFGGGYYVKNVLLRGEGQYAAASTYRVEYAVEEEKDVATVYINEVSWNTYMQSQFFLDAVQGHLNGLEISNEELGQSLEAFLASDLRVPSIRVTTDSAEKSVLIARAVEAAMTLEFAEEIREIAAISVIDAGDEADKAAPDVRMGRALGLGAVLSCFFAVIILLLKETWDDSIWLPDIIWKRYGVKTLGTIASDELPCNVEYLLKGKVAVCAAWEGIDALGVLRMLKLVCGSAVGEEWFAAGVVLESTEICKNLREADGILLAVPAGRHVGKTLEYVLEYLEMQDCPVTAAILWGADERLIRWYYGGRKGC